MAWAQGKGLSLHGGTKVGVGYVPVLVGRQAVLRRYQKVCTSRYVLDGVRGGWWREKK